MEEEGREGKEKKVEDDDCLFVQVESSFLFATLSDLLCFFFFSHQNE